MILATLFSSLAQVAALAQPLPGVPRLEAARNVQIQDPFGALRARAAVQSQSRRIPQPAPTQRLRPLVPFGLRNGRLVDFFDPLAVVIDNQVTLPLMVGPGVSLAQPGWHEILLEVPQFQSTERAIFGIPQIPPGTQAPLLVVCHAFGVSHADVLFNTTFFEETQARGWFLLAPLSRSPAGPGSGDINFGSEASQEFTFEALQYVLDQYPVDRQRIYGVGFSMGAAQATSFAVRHLDPRDGIFAALVAHTGSLDQADTWRSDPNSRPALETIFGGTPVEEPFGYRNASVVEFDPLSGAFDPDGVHQIVNLAKTPIQLWWADQDPQAYLVDQTMGLGNLLLSLQAPGLEQHPVPATQHSWSTLPEDDVCDWLTVQQLEIPREGRVVVDRDGRWFFFDVSGIVPGEFGGFDFSVDLAGGKIEILQSEGISTIETDLARWNGGPSQPLPLSVGFEAVDLGDTLILRNVSDVPVTVFRNGVSQATGWVYDPLESTLTITETDIGPHTWSFLP